MFTWVAHRIFDVYSHLHATEPSLIMTHKLIITATTSYVGCSHNLHEIHLLALPWMDAPFEPLSIPLILLGVTQLSSCIILMQPGWKLFVSGNFLPINQPGVWLLSFQLPGSCWRTKRRTKMLSTGQSRCRLKNPMPQFRLMLFPSYAAPQASKLFRATFVAKQRTHSGVISIAGHGDI